MTETKKEKITYETKESISAASKEVADVLFKYFGEEKDYSPEIAVLSVLLAFALFAAGFRAHGKDTKRVLDLFHHQLAALEAGMANENEF